MTAKDFNHDGSPDLIVYSLEGWEFISSGTAGWSEANTAIMERDGVLSIWEQE
jgi:hypothetical protein